MKARDCLSLLLAFLVMPPIAPTQAESNCQEIKGELVDMYAEPLACVRKKCPDFKILAAGLPNQDPCVQGCESDKASKTPHFLETDLERCRSIFTTPDEQDFFTIAWCMTASYAVAKVVEPFMLCTRRDACSGKDVWNSPPCIKQCEDDATQLVEVTTSTVERCSGMTQAKIALCNMVQRAINVCFVPEQCDRLEKVVKRECPELLK